MQYRQSRHSEVQVTLGGILLCAIVAALTFFYARVEVPSSAQAVPVAAVSASPVG